MSEPKFAVGDRVRAQYWTEVDGCQHRPGVVAKVHPPSRLPGYSRVYGIVLDPGTVPDYSGQGTMIPRPISFEAVEVQLIPEEATEDA